MKLKLKKIEKKQIVGIRRKPIKRKKINETF
jgi:hypothetical protein